MSITQSANQPTHRSGLRSTNVFLENAFEPVEAIILIENGKISDIIKVTDSEVSPSYIKELETDWKVENYGHLCIFPGLIDSNVHLHAGYDKDWDNVSNSTKLAAAGGITTVVDNPVMMKDFETFEQYLEVIKERIEILKQKSKVDFGVFGVLESRTQENIDEVLKLGVLGLKGYLFNCLQNTVGFTDPEQLGAIMDYLNENHPGLLLAFHPEMATEREMYSSSPCRLTKKEDRLDMDFEIKSLEFGGGANRGAYLEELSMTPGSDGLEDDDCPTPSIDTPTKLKSKIRKAKEKTEINQLAHAERMTYLYEENKNDPDNYSSDSDSDVFSDISFNSPGVKSARTPTSGKKEKSLTLPEPAKVTLSKFAKKSLFSNKEEITEVASEENDSSPQKLDKHNPRLVIRKSIFAGRNNSDLENQIENSFDRQLFDHNNNETPEPSSGSPFKTSENENSSNGNSATTVLNEHALVERNNKLNGAFPTGKPRKSGLMIEFPSKISRLLDNETQEDKLIHLPDNVDTGLTKTSLQTADKEHDDGNRFSGYSKTFLGSGLTNEYKNESSASDFLDSTRKLVLTSGNSFMEQDKADKSLSAEKQPVYGFSPEFQDNGQDKENTPTMSSPLSGELADGSNLSSLMLRRMGRKSNSMNLSAPTGGRPSLAMPGRRLTMMNSLELTKSPNHKNTNEDKFNKSYRIFLANRPQSWEENAVTLILSKLKPETKLRVMMQNMSLASSFLKLRQKKKSDEKFMDMVYGDTSVAYMFFNERSVKPTETKYKASPPIRDKENRKLLIENFRLGGVDIVTSYHFYVPPQYKEIDGGNFRRAFAGYNSIGFNLQSLWTTMYIFYKKNNKFKQEHLYQKKVIGDLLCKMMKVLCSNPAELLRIDDRKGSIAKGKDADFVVWDPYKKINNQELCSTHIFSKRILFGVVHKTYLRGQVIYDKDNMDVGNEVKQVKAEFVTAKNLSVKC